MAVSDGGRGNEPPDGIQVRSSGLTARWNRQIWAMYLASWLGGVIAGSSSPHHVLGLFPSALTGRQSHVDRRRDVGREARDQDLTEHVLTATLNPRPSRIDAVDALDAVEGGSADDWTTVISTSHLSTVAGIEVVFARMGDPRKLHDSNIVDSAVLAGAALRMRHHDGRTRILVPGDLHEHLLEWRSYWDDPIDSSGHGSGQHQHHLPHVPSLQEADREFRAAVLRAEHTMDELGLRAGQPQARAILEDATRALTDRRFPRDLHASTRSLLIRASTITWMCDLALDEDSVSITADHHLVRRQTLVDLDRSARTLMESCMSWSTDSPIP